MEPSFSISKKYMNIDGDDLKDYRFERKFFIQNKNIVPVETLIKLNSSGFNEIFYERYVNNIYFDTANLELLKANEYGFSKRAKFRVRWYGNIFGLIEKPVLEIKIREGQLNRKESFGINSFELEKESNPEFLINEITKSDISDYIKSRIGNLKPVLLNRYRRKYFLSGDGNYRITLDKDLIYYNIKNFDVFFLNTLHQVLELKYNPEFDEAANTISNQFPFRLSKNSKYVTGMHKIYDLEE